MIPVTVFQGERYLDVLLPGVPRIGEFIVLESPVTVEVVEVVWYAVKGESSVRVHVKPYDSAGGKK